MQPDRKKLLSDLNNTAYGAALREYLNEELTKIDTVKGVTTLDEAIGRKHAVELVEKLFAFMESKQEVKKGNNQYY